jgi:hypothetical protein
LPDSISGSANLGEPLASAVERWKGRRYADPFPKNSGAGFARCILQKF